MRFASRVPLCDALQPTFSFRDNKLMAKAIEGGRGGIHDEFLTLLAVCHTVRVVALRSFGLCSLPSRLSLSPGDASARCLVLAGVSALSA